MAKAAARRTPSRRTTTSRSLAKSSTDTAAQSVAATRADDTRAAESRPEMRPRARRRQGHDGVFPNVQALPGMAQRWVRIRLAGDDDWDNFDRRRQSGWEVRPLDTVPMDQRPTATGREHPVLANAFLASGHVLMHMPEEWVQEEREALAKRTQDDANSALRQFRDETPLDARREGDEMIETFSNDQGLVPRGD